MPVVQIIRFTSKLPESDVHKKYEDRLDKFREVPGLLQKYYLNYSNGDHGAIYIWESDEASREYQEGPLRGSISSAYEVVGEVASETAELVMRLR